MFTLVRSVSLRRLLTEQVPALTASLLIAEIFYKFHSFLLETGAFLATWYAIDALRHITMTAFWSERDAVAGPKQ